MQINGRNNSQLCLPNNVKNYCVRLHVAKSLTGRFQTLRNNSPTARNNMQHGVQTDATSKHPTMLGVIAYAWRISGSRERTMCSEI